MKSGFFCILILFTNIQLFSVNHSLGSSFLVGNHFRYGGEYKSTNAPRGMYQLTTTSDGINGTSFNEPLAISAELQLRYIFHDWLFLSLGAQYTSGSQASGKFPLRDPFTGDVYKESGVNAIATRGTFKQSHYGFPVIAGLLMRYNNDVRVFMGGGVAYSFASLSTSQISSDSNLSFDIQYAAKPAIMQYLGQFMIEYVLIGNSETSNYFTVNAGLQFLQGKSIATKDAAIEADVSATPSFPLLEADSASVDISGFKAFFGFSFYFLRS